MAIGMILAGVLLMMASLIAFALRMNEFRARAQI